MGLPLFSKNLACFGCSVPAFGSNETGSQLFTLDFVELDPSFAAQSSHRIGSAMTLFDFCKTGSSLFAQTCTCLDLLILLEGLVCMPQTSSAFDFAHLGTLPLLKFLVRMGFSPFVVSRVHMELFLIISDLASLDLSMLMHRWA